MSAGPQLLHCRKNSMNSTLTPLYVRLSPKRQTNNQDFWNSHITRWITGLVLMTVCWANPVYSYSPKPEVVINFELSQIQLNGMKTGGRPNTIAVHPEDDKLILVASQSGGLFRTVDAGKTWKRINALPFLLLSVAFVPGHPNLALATAMENFESDPGGGGVWRSTDKGKTWKQTPIPPGVKRGRLSAFDISIDPDSEVVYAGHADGILTSNDLGITWSHDSVFNEEKFKGLNRSVYSVLALGNKTVLAGGPAGLRRFANGKWSPNIIGENEEVLKVDGIHAFGRSPFSPKHAYLASSSGDLYFTENAGQSWTKIKPGEADAVNCKTRANCGGIRFIKAKLSLAPTKSLELYFGDKCCLFRKTCPLKPSGSSFDYSAKWKLMTLDHQDTRDLAFNKAGTPLLLATDGGLHNTNDGGKKWQWNLTGVEEGYNGLQVYEVRGQYIEDVGKGVGRHDLYFGTQDNGFWFSSDGGNTWQRGVGAEGAYIQAEQRVAKIADSKITRKSCAPCTVRISDALFKNTKKWTPPDDLNCAGCTITLGEPVYVPTILSRGEYVEPIKKVPADGLPSNELTFGLAITPNFGDTWSELVTFEKSTRLIDIPKLGLSGGDFFPTILYQAIQESSKVGLARILIQPVSKHAEVFYPAMNNFGSIGLNTPAESAGGITVVHLVFAVDPGDPDHLIAADVENERVMQSFDGGENWVEVPELTSLVKQEGAFLFIRPPGAETSWKIRPIITAISFSPQDPDLVLVATVDGGLYFSSNNGQSWQHIADTEVVTNATAIHWMSANEAVISTYGRGLWHLLIDIQKVKLEPPEIEIELLCDSCLFVISGIPEPDPVDQRVLERGVIVFEGAIQGARVESGILKEVFVTPGSSVVFVSKDERVANIRVTRTNRSMGYRGVRHAPRAPRRGWITRALAFDEEQRFTAAGFAAKAASKLRPKPTRYVAGHTRSRFSGAPYVRVTTNRFAGVSVAAPNAPLEVSGGNIPRSMRLEILIDEEPSGYKIEVSDSGAFRTQISAPQEFGMHSVELRDSATGKLLDSSIFIVNSSDDSPARKPTPKRRSPRRLRAY